MKFIQRKTNSKKYYTFFHKKTLPPSSSPPPPILLNKQCYCCLLNNTYPFSILYIHKPLEAKLNDLTDSPFLALTPRLNLLSFL